MSWKKPKIVRKQIKDEKRLLKALYRAGVLIEWDLSEMHWAAYSSMNNRHNSQHVYKVELYNWINTGCGDWDEREVLQDAISNYIWKFYDKDNNTDFDDIDIDDIEEHLNEWYSKNNTTIKQIKFFESLPTVINDSKINRLMKIDYSEM